jgi:serine/threonine protein kinase/Tol biopolymer transport system component
LRLPAAEIAVMDADRWYRAADVFEAALDRPESQQREYIRQACSDDEALLREVEALIAEESRSSTLDTPLDTEAIAELSTLTHVGAYRIDALLGSGGMGEVYRAFDARLGRDVAIKILPPGFGRDRERLARFAREAQVLAALNHPNIAAIYGVEPPLDPAPGASEPADLPSAGVEALVLELVEGPTLAERLAHGRLPLEEALAIAAQIAAGLAAAHDAGIVHRDLKPANVKVREDGTVKVLDFGLAKSLDPARAAAHPATTSPTITTSAQTAAGLILGTAAYLSPEQAKGKPADQRSDVWAFGCVLYEMLTAHRAFSGGDVTETLAAILRSEPDWSALPHDTPTTVHHVLRRCLEKEPGRRYYSIADARLDLMEAAVEPPPLPSRHSPVWRERLAWAAAALTLVAALAYVTGRRPPALPLVRFSIPPPDGHQFGSIGGIAGSNSGVAISSDGTRLAFTATDPSGRSGLWVRSLDAGAPRMLADTEGAYFPFWSPDGRTLGFFAGDKMKAIDPATGAVRTIADAAPGRGASWGSRDVIVFGHGNLPRLARVSADGSGLAEIPIDEGTGVRRQPLWPHFLPDGRHFIYFSLNQESRLMIASIDPGFTPRVLVRSDMAGAVVQSGLLLFGRDRVLLQQHFDPNRLELSGEATPLNEGILVNLEAGLADFAISSNGVLVYQGERGGRNQFAWVDRHGRQLSTVGFPGRYRTFALSPDEQQLAYDDVTGGDIWILDLERRTSSRVTTTPGYETSPVWVDRTRLVYRKNGGGIFEKDVSGTVDERRLSSLMVNGPSQVTKDGKVLFFWVVSEKAAQGIGAMPLAGADEPEVIVQSAFPNVEPQLSPDGRWLAYASPETGRNEVYVQPYPPTGARWQVSSDGGRQPLWRADGRELYFVADDRRFYAVDVPPDVGPADWGLPQFLFTMRANVFNTRNTYVPSHDGRRFLINTLAETGGEPLQVVLNWTSR